MIAHLIQGHAQNYKNASDEAVNIALSIKFPDENLTTTSITPSHKIIQWCNITLQTPAKEGETGQNHSSCL